MTLAVILVRCFSSDISGTGKLTVDNGAQTLIFRMTVHHLHYKDMPDPICTFFQTDNQCHTENNMPLFRFTCDIYYQTHMWLRYE